MRSRPKLYAFEPACQHPETRGVPFRSPPAVLFKAWAPFHVCEEVTSDDGTGRGTTSTYKQLARVRWLGPPLEGMDHTVDPPVPYYLYRVRCTLCGLEDEIEWPTRICIGGTAQECQDLWGFDFSKEIAAEEAAERFR